MKKFLRSLLAITLLLGIVSTTALAAEPRWRNVASISPSMSAYDGSYTSAIIALEGTTKIECTLTLYEKGFFGNYTQVSQVSETYNGPRHEFVGYYAIKSGTTYKLNTTAKVTRNALLTPASARSLKPSTIQTREPLKYSRDGLPNLPGCSRNMKPHPQSIRTNI